MPTARPITPADRVALFLYALVKAVAFTFPKGQEEELLILWQRLKRLGARFTAILAGNARPRAQSPATQPQTTSRSSQQPKPPPENYGLMLRQLPSYQHYRSHFENLLQQPEMAALLQEKPQLRRVLNPLCRMLSLKPLPAPKPAPQPEAPEPAAPPDRAQSQAEPQHTPEPIASPESTGDAPPSLWSEILRELASRKETAQPEPVPTG
jgi:hypothetical protein